MSDGVTARNAKGEMPFKSPGDVSLKCELAERERSSLIDDEIEDSEGQNCNSGADEVQKFTDDRPPVEFLEVKPFVLPDIPLIELEDPRRTEVDV